METQISNFKVRLGLFVALGFVFFVIAIFLIGRQKNLFDPVFRLTTTFYNVSGLQVGNNIRFSGINVGTVGNIELINDSTVRVDMIIKRNVQPFIKTDAQAAIGSEGIIGDRVLIITQGSTEMESIKDKQYISSIEPVETDAIIASMAITAFQLAEIMTNINHGKGTIGRLINDSEIAVNIDNTILNLRKSSKGLDENMEAAKSNFLLKGYFNKKEKEAERDSIKMMKKAQQEVKDSIKMGREAQKEVKDSIKLINDTVK